MTKPEISKRGPYVLDCEPGTYAWCACGKSSKQPYCDGSHAGTGIVPKIEEVTEARKVAWCGCKHSKNGAFCDGSHSSLPS
ncbi:MAG: CDGSH iron-sulfur domain-containing protein [Planctomycetota bacterium]|nr:CDGSH iron-sulfur domain-containing protein [Planctomycetota bacterium]